MGVYFKFFLKKIGVLRTMYKVGGGLSKRKTIFKTGIPPVKKIFFYDLFRIFFLTTARRGKIYLTKAVFVHIVKHHYLGCYIAFISTSISVFK